MYPIERTLKMFKTYVRNKARPEASMAEGYLYDETIGFVTKYMQRFFRCSTSDMRCRRRRRGM